VRNSNLSGYYTKLVGLAQRTELLQDPIDPTIRHEESEKGVTSRISAAQMRREELKRA
jgi:hypothetical protein